MALRPTMNAMEQNQHILCYCSIVHNCMLWIKEYEEDTTKKREASIPFRQRKTTSICYFAIYGTLYFRYLISNIYFMIFVCCSYFACHFPQSMNRKKKSKMFHVALLKSNPKKLESAMQLFILLNNGVCGITLVCVWVCMLSESGKTRQHETTAPLIYVLCLNLQVNQFWFGSNNNQFPEDAWRKFLLFYWLRSSVLALMGMGCKVYSCRNVIRTLL